MPKPTKLNLLAEVETRSEGSKYLANPGDAVLIRRGRPRLLLLSCPCGCGEAFPINLDPRAGKAWLLYSDDKDGVTLYPSVWRESGCYSHYIICRNRIYLFGRDDDDFDYGYDRWRASELAKSVEKALPATYTPFHEIAEQLGAIPWDVLIVCRTLARQGKASEGSANLRGCFRRIGKI